MRAPIMNDIRWLRAALRGFVCCSIGGALIASAQQPPEEPPPQHLWIETPMKPVDNWPRHFRVGALVGLNLEAEFAMGGNFTVSGSQPGEPGQPGVNHNYDDGYVRVDQTGNAQGRTSFWGYQNASQYDPVAQTLTYHSAKSFEASGNAESEDAPYFGVDMAYGGKLWRWGPTQIGWEFGFGFLPISIKDNQPVDAAIIRTVHTFSTGGILLPGAPYNGGPSGIGPTIPDLATALPDDDEISGSITGSRTLDVSLYVARLGPMLHWELHPRWAVSFSAGPAVGYVDGELRFDETIVSADGGNANNRGRTGDADFVFGGYVNATLLFHAEEHGDIYVGVQYMPLGSASVSGGGREARLDMSGGLYFSAGVNWPF